MRIIYLLNGFVRGGAEFGLVHLLKQGFFEGTDTRIMSLFAGNAELIAEVESYGYPLETLSMENKSTVMGMVKALPAVGRRFQDFQPDLVILSLPQANIIGRLAASMLPNICVASFEHNIRYARAIYGRILKRLSPNVDVVLSDTEETARVVIEHFYKAPPKHRLIVPLTCFTPMPEGQKTSYDLHEPIKLVAVGRLTTTKNHCVLIDAVNRLKGNGIEVDLTIIGEGPEAGPLMEKAKSAQLDDRVHLPGFIDNWMSDTNQYDMLVLPSLREGLSITTLEAMSRGLPVIASDLGGISDYGRDRENLIKLSTPSVELVCEAVLALSRDQSLRQKIGQGASKTVQELYGEENVRHQLAALRQDLEKICEAKKDKSVILDKVVS